MCFVTQSVHYSYNTLRSWGISSPVCLELILSASLDPKVWEIWRTNEQSPHRSIRTRVLELWICGIGLIYCGLSATCEEFKVLLCKVHARAWDVLNVKWVAWSEAMNSLHYEIASLLIPFTNLYHVAAKKEKKKTPL